MEEKKKSVENIIIKIPEGMLWNSNDYTIFPSILQKFEKEKLYSWEEIRESIHEKMIASNYSFFYNVTRNIRGLYIKNNNLIYLYGVNLFEYVNVHDPSSKLRLSQEGIELAELYKKANISKEWMNKLAEILLKYEIRVRTIFYYMSRWNYGLKFQESKKWFSKAENTLLIGRNESHLIFRRTLNSLILELEIILNEKEKIKYLNNFSNNVINQMINNITKFKKYLTYVFQEKNLIPSPYVINLTIDLEQLISKINKIEKIKGDKVQKYTNYIEEIINKINDMFTKLFNIFQIENREQEVKKNTILPKHYVFNELLERHKKEILGKFWLKKISENGINIQSTPIVIESSKPLQKPKRLTEKFGKIYELSTARNKQMIPQALLVFKDLGIIKYDEEMEIWKIDKERFFEIMPEELSKEFFSEEIISSIDKFYYTLKLVYEQKQKRMGISVLDLVKNICDEFAIKGNELPFVTQKIKELLNLGYIEIPVESCEIGLPIHGWDGKGIPLPPYEKYRILKIIFKK